jgi:uncharacterized protein
MPASTASTLGVMVRDEETSAFFDAAAAGTLVVQVCGDCGHRQFPQPFTPGTSRCHGCTSSDLSWQPVSGQGNLVTWTVLQNRPQPDGTPAPVVIIGVIELDEGPWVHTQLRDVTIHDLTPGLRLIVDFERPAAGEPLPVFRPA